MTHVRPEPQPEHAHRGDGTEIPQTRELQSSERQPGRRGLLALRKVAGTPVLAATTGRKPVSAQKKRTGAAKNVAVMALSAGIVATLALPAYAFAPNSNNTSAEGTDAGAALSALTADEAQNVIVAADAQAATAARDNFTATSPEELAERAREKELADQRAAQRAQLASTGPTAADLVAQAKSGGAAPVPAANAGSVVAVARQYIGVPYVYGGASPSGFDCSGLTMYVFAQFGVSLPHSSARQGANGIPVPAGQAVPGDLVIIDGGAHVGIYTGGGRMIDAPMPGRVVSERAIYSSNHYFVRYNI